MDKGTVYFFTGLSGAGKTTIGGLLYRRMKAKRNDVVLLDGDQLRRLSFHKKSGYTTEERRRGAYYNFEMCKMLADQGIDVVVCSICMYTAVRDWNRENIENYKEIYIKVSRETLLRRNQKELYTAGKNVVGVDLPFDEPRRPDIVIENDGGETPEAIVERLERAFGLRE